MCVGGGLKRAVKKWDEASIDRYEAEARTTCAALCNAIAV